MKKHTKVFVYLMIVILALTTLTSGTFAQGGDNGGGGDSVKDPKPELSITKIRPKESTEYSWILEPSFGEWTKNDDTDLHESMLDFTFKRVLDVDNLGVYIEANLSTFAADSLVVELGYIGWVDEEGNPMYEEDGIPFTDENYEAVGDQQRTFIALYSQRNVSYQRIAEGGEAIKLNFLWEDIDRSLFDDPETYDEYPDDEVDNNIVEGINRFRLGVEYVKSRGNVGMETDQREFALEEHEAFAFASIESDLLGVLDNAKFDSDATDSICRVGADEWLINPFNLPLGEGDEFLIQALVETNIPEELQFDKVTFSAYPYLESSDEYKVERDVEGYPEIATAEFPSTGYVQSSVASLASVTITYDEEFWDQDSSEVTQNHQGDADLKSLFDEENLPYLLPIGSGLPVVSAVEFDPTTATHIVEQATRDNLVATITVTAEDGREVDYEIPFEFDGNTDARLDSLTINGGMVVGHAIDSFELESGVITEGIVNVPFDPSVYFYHIFISEDGDDDVQNNVDYSVIPKDDGVLAPENIGTLGDPPSILGEKFFASLIPDVELVEYKTTTYGDSAYPRKETIIVTAEDQTHKSTYTILIAPLGYIPEEEEENNGSGEGGGDGGEMPQPKTGKGLDVLAVDNVLVEGFVAGEVEEGEIELSVLLDEGTRSLPSVTAVASNPEATVQHIKPTRLPGKYKIKVNETDDSTTLYTLNMEVEGLEEGEFIELGAILPQEILGLWLPPTGDDFVLGRTSTQIRFWVSEQLLSPQLRIYVDEAGEDTLFNPGNLVKTISTSELKMSGGNGKHSRSTAENGDGGYYKYNLKGRNFPSLVEGENYIIALFEFDGSSYSVVHFQLGQPAMLHFTMGETTKTSVDHRNRDINLLEQR
ncbi:hypothetical protein SANA_12830 [Gottschalkiaceae bacterium SANA]|nr:hypothetical protein SANA_12830 [Gottschalkiaceae bacterium SANA]